MDCGARPPDIDGSQLILVTMTHSSARWLGAALLAGLGAAFVEVRVSRSIGSIAELLQGADAAANLTLLLGAAILSVAKLEESIRRKKALALIHELKELAHVVDMHQLTKEPAAATGGVTRTESSPKRTMTPFELGRYLDYCSEMLSVTSKVGALYIQALPDPVALEAVDDLEELCTGLSRKIWQKIMILDRYGGGAPGDRPPA